MSELEKLEQEHPAGYVVRLHILGDFYSAEYIAMWRGALAEFPGLRIFGYTAWPNNSDLGSRIVDIRDKQWDRFAVRTSGASDGPRVNVYAEAKEAPVGEIICPAQLNKTASCATCALCWGSKKPIAFLKH